MSRNNAAQNGEKTPMWKWLLPVLLVFAFIAATVIAAAPRDRDDDGLPDRWERSHGLSAAKPSARRDPDHDRLINRRELRLRTHPRRPDSDRDNLRDGAEVRRFHTNPRKRDTDADGFRDRCELRKGTNPRKDKSRPKRRCSDRQRQGPPGPAPSPPPRGGFPNRATTGVPAGWTPARTVTTDLTVTTPGAVLEDIRLTNGANILVRAPNVTIRRAELQGGFITNQDSTCQGGLVVEDVTFEPEPGRPYGADSAPVIGEGGFTARRVEVWKRVEGFRLSDCGPTVIEDSFVYIEGDVYPGCPLDWHSDGAQAFHARGGTFRNNTFVFGNPCGTSPYYMGYGAKDASAPSINTGRYNVDRLLVAGGGYVFRQQVPGSVTGLRIVNKSWVYGPIDNRCSVLSPWDAKIVDIDSNYQVTRVVRDQPCNTEVVS
jgi:hypothetical protein